MANDIIRIDIFNESHELPKDIITYIGEHHCFEGYRQELLTCFTDTFFDYRNLSSETERKAFEKFRYYGNCCVQKLIENGIFDVTVDELVGAIPENYTWQSCSEASMNAGAKLFYKCLGEAIAERADTLLEEMTSFTNQVQQAEQDRDSKITGSGFEIITNSVIGFGVWAAMERSELQKQASVADAQFRRNVNAIQRRLEEHSNTRLSQYERDVWLPQLKKSADLFIITLFGKYIDTLISHGKFDPNALNHIDIAKSQNILQNIKTTENKVGILNAAFLSCPCNPEVYDAAIGICNTEEIVSCAKIFGVDEFLKSKYTDICRKIAISEEHSEKEMYNELSPYINLVSLLEGKTTEEEQDAYVSIHREMVHNKISGLSVGLKNASNERIKSFIQSVSVTSITEMADISDEDLLEFIRSNIIAEIVKRDDPDIYESAISCTTDEIATIIKEYFSKVSRAKNEYLTNRREYDTYKDSSDREIEMLNAQISKLGIFSSSKKKKLNARIIALKEHAYALEIICAASEKAYYALI